MLSSRRVVLYLTSTSNHNPRTLLNTFTVVVLYLTSTSNHNQTSQSLKLSALCYILLLHQTTTALYWANCSALLCYILLLHQTTTELLVFSDPPRLCYILLLHQTTTTPSNTFTVTCCVISYFYIKPQPIWDNPLRWKPLRDSFVYRKWCWCVTFYGQKY